MTASIPAAIRPNVLAWARSSSNIAVEDAAKAAGVKAGRVSEWESGKGSPSVAQLRRLAGFYKRPLAFFFLPEPPKEESPVKDFRTLPGHKSRPVPREVAFALRRAMAQRQSAIELAERIHRDVASPWAKVGKLPEDAEQAGETLREFLAITIELQAAWKTPNDALRGWIAQIEETGILVLQASGIALHDMRAFSISQDPFPVILLNGADSPRGRLFSLLHEMGHLLQRTSGLCDLEDAGAQLDVEAYCNAVAAATLMPRVAFTNHSLVKAADKARKDWTNQELAEIGKTFNASDEAVLRRLLTVGKTTTAFYAQWRKHRQAEFDAAQLEGKTQSGGPPYHVRHVRNLGPSYVRLAFQAYDNGAITLASLSSYLSATLGLLPKMREELVRLEH